MSRSLDSMAMPSGQSMQMVDHTAALAAYKPEEHGGAVVVPNVQAATFAFPKAEDGKHSFGCAYMLQDILKLTDPNGNRPMMDIYSRLSSPAMRVCEQTMHALEPGADWALLFPSGMGALNCLVHASCFQVLTPGGSVRDVIVHSYPLYGGSHALFHNVIQRWGFQNVPVDFQDTDALRQIFQTYGDRIGLVFCETPANPTLDMIDLRALRALLDEVFPGVDRPPLAVDNTFMGIFQQPLQLGADIVLYSATKYLDGHADAIAGFLTGRHGPMTFVKPFSGGVVEAPFMNAIAGQRTIGGYTPSSDVSQRLTTHMATYTLRMRRQASVAEIVANWLYAHPKIQEVRFPTLLTGKAQEIYLKQCTGPSAMIAFRLKTDTEVAAFRFLDGLAYIPRAVSLGFVRTLANHPSTWTHSDISLEDQLACGITPGLIRLSIGIEEPEHLIEDLEQALSVI